MNGKISFNPPAFHTVKPFTFHVTHVSYQISEYSTICRYMT